MISAYESFEEIKSEYGIKTIEEFEKYKKRTIIKEDAMQYLEMYMIRNKCCEEVQTFIIKLVINEHFNKVKLCNDGSYRNNVILIRPDGLHVTHGEFTLENFNDHMNNIETLWINITDKTWKEIDEEMKWMDDMYPDEYYEECYYD